MTFMVGFNPSLVLIASFVNKKSSWKLGKLDIICGILALLGLALWRLTAIGNLAIAFSILADGLGAIPTVVKSINFPETENYKIFLLGAVSAVITLLTITKWQFEYYAFPLYVALVCTLLFILIKFKLGESLKRIVNPIVV